MNELQKRDELAGDAVNKLRRMLDKFNNRPTLDNLRLSERYLNGEIAIFIFWDVRGSTKTNDLVAIFQYGECPVRLPSDRTANHHAIDHARNIALHVDRGSGDTTDTASSDKQEMMLVNNVKTVEFPNVDVATVLRLERVDETFRSRLHSLYFSPITGYVFGRSIANGKAPLIARRAAVSFHQLPHQMIESGSEIVISVPSDQGKAVGDRDSFLSQMNFLSSLRINLDSETIRISVPVVENSAFQLTDVMFGPFDFRADSPQPV